MNQDRLRLEQNQLSFNGFPPGFVHRSIPATDLTIEHMGGPAANPRLVVEALGAHSPPTRPRSWW
ncbi:hypothetical protein [Streptomyces sp. NBC_01451]|uniref:hypothetical protein n=1 Tax=Streptomyces sp. NBC_01451 TaxID=2903872 RepID=UPI002E37655F|nr:hypothetical protein [Streptomyces sp. NBC_01451]